MGIYQTVKGTPGGFSIGKTEGDRDIIAFGSGGERTVIITGGIHARECYTALVVLEQFASFGAAEGGAYFVPLVNPDGACIFESGLYGDSERDDIGQNDKIVWKANGRAVDLNCNFDANFGGGKSNKLYPAPSDYIGCYPMSERETKALADFTREVKPIATVSYHCMGGELYWEFGQSGKAKRRDRRIASSLARHIGVKRVDSLFSAGGYKDWCIEKLGIPAFTIELISRGKHPFLAKDYEKEIERNRDVPEYLLRLLKKFGL